MSNSFHSHPRDADIVGQLRKGNEKALEQIFQQSHAGLFYYAMQIVRDQPVVEDVITEAFLKLWEKRQDFHNLSSVKSFLYITVKNTCINELRQSTRSMLIREEVSYLSEAVEHVIDEQKIVKAEILQKIWTDIEKLPPMRKKIFKMIYVEGLNSFEVADALAISVDTVRVQKARALNMLRWLFRQK